MDDQKLAWVRDPVTRGMNPGWEYIICSMQAMSLDLFPEGLLIEPLECLPLFLHVIFGDFPNKQATQGGSFLIFLSFLCIIPFLDSTWRDLKEQWFILWCQTRISLSSLPKRSSVDPSLATLEERTKESSWRDTWK